MSGEHEMHELLAASAAGAITAEEDRRLRQHAQACPVCAERLAEFAALAGALASLPRPPLPDSLVQRTEALLAVELAAGADRRQAVRLAVAAGCCGWVVALAGAYLLHLLTGGGVWIWAAWLAILPFSAVPAAAAVRRSRLERSVS